MDSNSTQRELFPLSIVILTKNVEDKLEDCLKSCQWVDDILVVDSGSTDRTIEIAKSFGAYVINQGWMGYGPQRRFAVTQAAHDWVFCIDADERLTPKLSESIRKALAGRTEGDDGGPHVYACSRRNWFLGRFLHHGSGYPDRQTRFFNRRYAHWTDDPIEEKLVSKEEPVVLNGDLLHYPSKSIEEFLIKQMKFAHLRADYLMTQKAPSGILRLCVSPVFRFIKSYFFKLGFLDGFPGFIYTAGGCIYAFVKHAMLIEMSRNLKASRNNRS